MNNESNSQPFNVAAKGPCSSCIRHGDCLGATMHASAAAHGHEACIGVVTLQRGQSLYRSGELNTSVYIVQSGALKVRRHSFDGTEEIVAFRQPGDVTGLESIARGVYGGEAVSLGITKVCRLPVESLKNELQRSPALSEQLFSELGREFDRLQYRLRIERLPAPARLASYLLGHLERRRQLFGSAIDSFVLPMSRVDLGRFLALAAETVSRIFTRLQQDGIIASEGHSIRVLDAAKLAAMIESHDEPAMARAA